MTETGIIGRVIDVRSTTIRVALDVGSKGFTKVGPDGLQTVGVVNSYITVPAGAHRVVGIVSGVYISGRDDQKVKAPLLSQDDTAAYEHEATVVGRFENDCFKSGLTGYPPLHAPVQAATPGEVKNIFLPKGGRRFVLVLRRWPLSRLFILMPTCSSVITVLLSAPRAPASPALSPPSLMGYWITESPMGISSSSISTESTHSPSRLLRHGARRLGR